MSAQLDALGLPMSGVRVVEASAGTGKTFTIATLYLRLVLEKALKPEQIVVATFTRAATAELSSRLRERLRLASQLLAQADPATPRDDDGGDVAVTRAAIAQALTPEGIDPGTLQQRARDAERAMDTAVIGTLHGFCNRVSSEFGFETGRTLASPELLEDLRGLQNEIVDDFWRAGSADADTARVLARTWGSPRALARQVADPRWRGRDIVIDENAPETMPLLHEQRGVALAWLETLRNSIAGWNDTSIGEADIELAACFTNKSARASRMRGLRAMHNWAISSMPSWPPPGVVDKAAESFSPGAMQALKTCPRLPQGPTFDAMIDLGKVFAALHALDAGAGALVLREARAFLECELPARLRGLGKTGHDQAVDDLARALDDTERGAHATAAIRKRWPVALVDEFQDTDTQQYTILDRIYRDVDNAHRGCLVMIGDPKQAIYRFRGGDIDAYLAARKSASSILTLDTNFRSSSQLVAAFNALYARAGEVLSSDPDHPIFYQKVNPSDRRDADPYRVNGNLCDQPLQFHYWDADDVPVDAPSRTKLALEDCANHIVELLSG
ncbi:MAG: UvrD-helicase domain-containing protein, partial [Rhodanobacteraceae bacterium]